MANDLAIADSENGTGYRFSWGLAIAGGVGATATTFLLLTLGSGFGLLLVHPLSHSTPSVPAFLAGGAIYFFAAQAFGFAVGGYIAGGLLGPLIESHAQEEVRAAVHGFISWAVAVLATLAVVGVASLMAASGVATAALYGATQPQASQSMPAAYTVDVLFEPGSASASAGSSGDTEAASAHGDPNAQSPGNAPGARDDQDARAQAARILEASIARGNTITSDDRTRLVNLISNDAGVSSNEANARVDRMQADNSAKAQQTADVARKVASYTSLWTALSLIFGALVAMSAAVFARGEDDREARQAA